MPARLEESEFSLAHMQLCTCGVTLAKFSNYEDKCYGVPTFETPFPSSSALFLRSGAKVPDSYPVAYFKRLVNTSFTT